MYSIRSLIIDDEPPAREVLCKLLATSFPQVSVTGQASTIEESITLINDHRPDLLFLDIELGQENIFDMLKRLSPVSFDIIFITAHNSYAIQAIRFSALDYILKPVSKDDLTTALDRLEGRRKVSRISEHLELLMHNLDPHKKTLKKIALPFESRIEVVSLNEIIHLEGDGNYTKFFLAGGKSLLVSNTIHDYEEMLKDSDFYRIHKSHLINLSHLKTYMRGEGGSVIMSDGSELEVARRRKEGLMSRLL
jgi:two-component system LytT family response regulator